LSKTKVKSPDLNPPVVDKAAMREAAEAACALMKVLSNPDRMLLLCEL
jgi:hypothetical protein